jgi:CRISPR-associated protein Cmr2
MMGEWQELSGISSPAHKDKRKKRDDFWSELSKDKGLDLQEKERLCAIAYVKRRFVHVWQELDGHKDWELSASVPSVSYMAAVHWLEDVMQQGDEALMRDFHDQARELKEDYGEWATDIACIKQACAGSKLKQRFSSLDGRLFFESELEKDKYAPLRPKLKALTKAHGKPSPFYAILMMDGDNLGQTKQALGDASKLSEALAEFTRQVPDIVKENNGFLIYAGGDDVLAILPLEDAMPCALACRNAYMDIFKRKKVEAGSYSISAAIEYAHMKLPLTMILKDAHKLLDDVAKDKTGRDALACRVWKPGGEQQTWAMPWGKAVKDGKVRLVSLAEKLAINEDGEPGYASKLLYHIRETLDMLDGAKDIGENILDMLVADYMGSGLLDGIKKRAEKEEKAKELIEPLLEQCSEFKNKQATGKYTADAALLLRFLAQKGVER